jgi:hypothetical protein
MHSNIVAFALSNNLDLNPPFTLASLARPPTPHPALTKFVLEVYVPVEGAHFLVLGMGDYLCEFSSLSAPFLSIPHKP